MAVHPPSSQKVLTAQARTTTRFLKIILPFVALIASSYLFNIRELVDIEEYTNSIKSSYDASFGVPRVESPGLKGSKMSFRLDDMRKVHRPDHGTFFFGPTSVDIKIPDEHAIDIAADW